MGLLGAPETFAVAPQWHLAGKVDVQLGRDMPVVCLCQDPRNLAFGRDQRDFVGGDAIIAATSEFLPDPVWLYGRYFERLEPWREVVLGRAGRPEIRLRLWRGTGFRGGYPLPYGP